MFQPFIGCMLYQLFLEHVSLSIHNGNPSTSHTHTHTHTHKTFPKMSV